MTKEEENERERERETKSNYIQYTIIYNINNIYFIFLNNYLPFISDNFILVNFSLLNFSNISYSFLLLYLSIFNICFNRLNQFF